MSVFDLAVLSGRVGSALRHRRLIHPEGVLLGGVLEGLARAGHASPPVIAGVAWWMSEYLDENVADGRDIAFDPVRP